MSEKEPDSDEEVEEEEEQAEETEQEEIEEEVEVDDWVEFYKVGAMKVMVNIENGKVWETYSECDCDSEVSEFSGIILGTLEKRSELPEDSFNNKYIEECGHEFGARCRFYRDQYEKMKKQIDIEKL